MKNNIFKNHKKVDTGFSISDFPEISKNEVSVKPVIDNKVSFIDKVKTENAVSNADKIEIIRPGWTYIYKDKKTNKTVFLEGPSTIIEKEDKYKVLNSLVALHENRKKIYNRMWGEGEYERMFHIPNYDYEYFDKLDEIYEEENSSVEYNSEDDYYEDYGN